MLANNQVFIYKRNDEGLAKKKDNTHQYWSIDYLFVLSSLPEDSWTTNICGFYVQTKKVEKKADYLNIDVCEDQNILEFCPFIKNIIASIYSDMYGQDPYQPYIQNANPQGAPGQGYPGQQPNGANVFGGNGMDPAGYRGIIDGGRQPSNKLSEEEYYDGEQSLSDNARKSFIGKVYALVSIQLLVTTAIGYIGYNSPGFKETFGSTAVVLILSVLMIALSIVIGCCTDFFRRYALPIFIIFTIVVSLLVAVCVSAYNSSVVLLSVGITLVLVIALTIYACTTKTDFTGFGPYLFIFCILLCCFGIVLIFWKNSVAQLIYACLGALLFSIYLIYDTQLILGKGQYSYSLDDAYLAAIQLYLDIINLFLNILRIVGATSN